MAGPQILYTTTESVKARLVQKVQFQADPLNLQQGELPDVLLLQMIADAETEVEQELRARYAIPFQSIKTKTYLGLPDHTKRAIRTIVDLKSVMNVLGTDFGDGGTFDASAYMRATAKRYDQNLLLLLGHDREAEDQAVKRYRKSPPLEDLMLAATNIADDGVRGTVFGSGSNDENQSAAYAAQQVNDPSRINLAGFNRWRR